ncbi:MAG: DUF3467 domain-containing protein [Planctomycetaceae bacterium]|nr:DUF3467 domain-containing protein [Planctomycetaceae bacterium]
MENNEQSEGAPGTLAPPSTAAPQVQATIEPESLEPIYTNFAKVTGTPEEMILDFGLNPHPISMGGPASPIKVSERLVMNYYTAKRLWAMLGTTLQRHEEAFGVLETDIMKRIRPQARGPRPS